MIKEKLWTIEKAGATTGHIATAVEKDHHWQGLAVDVPSLDKRWRVDVQVKSIFGPLSEKDHLR